MKTINKQVLLSAIAAFVLLYFIGCDSMLTVETKNALPQDKVKTEEGCEALIIGAYNMMQKVTYLGRDLICIPDVLADNCKISPSASRYTGQYNFQPYYNLDIWADAYQQIKSLNEAIKYAKELTPSDKTKGLEGEAMFLRALNYHNLAIVYARLPNHLVNGFNLGVPILLDPFYNEGGDIVATASVPRAKVDDLWKQIETDLEQAFILLNNNDKGLYPYRAGSLASKAMLSRIYLYLEQWDKCIEASDYVIRNAPIGLYTGTYTDIFAKGTESIFELRYTVAQNLGPGSLQSMYGTYDNGKRDADGFGDGSGSGEANMAVSDDLLNLIDQDSDKRFSAMRKVIYQGQKLWWTTKFNSWGGVFGLDNIPLIRMAEIHLNRAEAYAHLKQYAECRDAVNTLRKTRGLNETDVNNNELLEEVLTQRRIELAFEGHRYFDLKRLGKPIARSEGREPIPYEDYRVVAPIGITELDVNKKLVNNPGY